MPLVMSSWKEFNAAAKYALALGKAFLSPLTCWGFVIDKVHNNMIVLTKFTVEEFYDKRT